VGGTQAADSAGAASWTSGGTAQSAGGTRTVTKTSATGGAAPAGGAQATGGLSPIGGTTSTPAGCVISGKGYQNGAKDPNNPCQSCQPAISTTSWTLLADGDPCGSGQVCHSGICKAGCLINGAFVSDGAKKEGNPCQSCQAAALSSDWSNVAEGSACATGQVCHQGACEVGCGIGGAYFASGAGNPSNPCVSCKPNDSTIDWTDTPSSRCVQAVAAGAQHACAIAVGSVYCWGSNDSGQLGNNSTTESHLATPVQGLTQGATFVATGGTHSCAVVSGAAVCWGDGQYGQLGNNSTGTISRVPANVANLGSGVSMISANSMHTCAIVNGGARCWGDNTAGALGEGTHEPSSTAVQVNGLTANVTAIAAGYRHSCAVVNGSALCWGDNANGQLGTNDTTPSSTPVQVQGLTANVTAISAGQYHTCAIVNGSVRCWGGNTQGELGNGSSATSSLSPVQVQGLTTGATSLSSGLTHVCALVGGAAKCWGWGDSGQLGNDLGTNSNTPVQVLTQTSGVSWISSGFRQACAVNGGNAFCWGRNNAGQLGNDTTVNSLSPTQVHFP
jgi:alpha-tubulin suppressor-like RCC1 family protein